MKFAVGQKLYASRADAAKGNSAFVGLIGGNFCHNLSSLFVFLYSLKRTVWDACPYGLYNSKRRGQAARPTIFPLIPVIPRRAKKPDVGIRFFFSQHTKPKNGRSKTGALRIMVNFSQNIKTAERMNRTCGMDDIPMHGGAFTNDPLTYRISNLFARKRHFSFIPKKYKNKKKTLDNKTRLW